MAVPWEGATRVCSAQVGSAFPSVPWRGEPQVLAGLCWPGHLSPPGWANHPRGTWWVEDFHFLLAGMGSLPRLFKMFCPNGLFICVKVEKTFFTWIKLIYPDFGWKRGKRRERSWNEHWTGSQETWSSLATSSVTLGKSPPLSVPLFLHHKKEGIGQDDLEESPLFTGV